MVYFPLSAPMLRLYGLAACFFTVNAVLTVLVPLQAAEANLSKATIGIVMALYMFVCMLLRPFVSYTLATSSIYRVMVGLLLLHGATIALYLSFHMEAIVVVRCLQGAVTAFFSMTMQIAIAELVRNEDRGQSMSLYSLSTVVPGLYGPMLAVSLFHASETMLIGLLLSLALIPFLCLIGIALPRTVRNEPTPTMRDWQHAFASARRSAHLRRASYAMFIGSAIFGALTAFAPLYIVEETTYSAGLFLTVQAIIVVGSRFLLRKTIPSDGTWNRRFMAFIFVSLALGTTLLATPLLYGAAVFIGLATALLYPSLTTYLSFAIPPETKTLLLGIFLASYDLGFALGGFATGWLIELTSYQVAFYCYGGLSLFGLVIVGRKLVINRELDAASNV